MTELDIDRLGHRGDGIAEAAGRTVYVPFALPGERVLVPLTGDRATAPPKILSPSPDRIDPPCPHFGLCGGCVLQHLAEAPYRAFKRRLVVDALADRGLSPDVAETVVVPPHARRRATFAGIMAGRKPLIGFHERSSHRVVDLQTCVVADPALLAAKPALQALTQTLEPRKAPADFTVTATTAGLDVAVGRLPGKDVERLRMALIDLAARFDLARLSVGGEVIVERRPPAVAIDGILVVPPPGGFLQASEAAETAMAAIVLDATARAKRVADLFAGVGTFALRLARTATVYAAEGDAGAVLALDRAARTMTGRSRIEPERRDLGRRPLVEKELDRFDAVVFDPPRTGAPEQSGWLAKSAVPTVVAVSCNPATLARDLRTLVDGGYRIESVTPIDQFLWSSHVEVVAVLRR